MKFVIVLTVLFVYIAMCHSFVVFIKEVNKEEKWPVHCKKETTIKELKEKINHLKNLPHHVLHVLHKHKVCKEKETVSACGISEGETVSIIAKEAVKGMFFFAAKIL